MSGYGPLLGDLTETRIKEWAELNLYEYIPIPHRAIIHSGEDI